ncbi:hypothetical protein C1645_791213, partial [Glomus cerebriforme]
MTLSYKKETELEKHVHEFRDYDFKLQVERLNTMMAKVYFLNKNNEIIFIPEGISCYNITDDVYEKSFHMDDTECYVVAWSNSYDFFYHSD